MSDWPFTLSAGYNADPIDGDEVDGPGTNWALWPTFVEAFEAMEPLILLSNDMAVFATCPDYAVRGENNTATIPRQDNEIVAVTGTSDYMVSAVITTLTVEPETNEIVVGKKRAA